MVEHGYIYLNAKNNVSKSSLKKLTGSEINLDFPSRGATGKHHDGSYAC